MFNKLESATKFFPLIFVLLSALSYIHLEFYYLFFDINILSYLDLSEIVLLFFNKSILITIFIIIIIVVSYILDYRINKETTSKIEEAKLKVKRGFRYKTLNNLWLIMIVTLLIYIVFVLITKDYIGLIFPIGYIILMLIFYVFVRHIAIIFISKHTIIFSFSFWVGIFTVSLFNLLTLTKSIETGYNVRYKNKVIKNISFTYNQKQIETSQALKYIGETRSSLFLFDNTRLETIIFKMENIDNMKIRLY